MNADTTIQVIPASRYHRKAKGTIVLVSNEVHDHFKGPGHQERADACANHLRSLRDPKAERQLLGVE